MELDAVLEAARAGDFLAVLGLGSGWTLAELRAQYRAQARRWHPDKNVGATDQLERAQAFIAVGEAFEALQAAAPAEPRPGKWSNVVPQDAPIRKRRSSTNSSQQSQQNTAKARSTQQRATARAPDEKSVPPQRARVPDQTVSTRWVGGVGLGLSQGDARLMQRAQDRFTVTHIDAASEAVESELDQLQEELRKWLEVFSREMSRSSSRSDPADPEVEQELRRVRRFKQHSSGVPPTELCVWLSEEGGQLYWRNAKNASGAPEDSLCLCDVANVKCRGKTVILSSSGGDSVSFVASSMEDSKEWARQIAKQVKLIKATNG